MAEGLVRKHARHNRRKDDGVDARLHRLCVQEEVFRLQDGTLKLLFGNGEFLEAECRALEHFGEVILLICKREGKDAAASLIVPFEGSALGRIKFKGAVTVEIERDAHAHIVRGRKDGEARFEQLLLFGKRHFFHALSRKEHLFVRVRLEAFDDGMRLDVLVGRRALVEAIELALQIVHFVGGSIVPDVAVEDAQKRLFLDRLLALFEPAVAVADARREAVLDAHVRIQIFPEV